MGLNLGACGIDEAPGRAGAATATAITAGTPDEDDPAVVALLGESGVFCTGSLVGARVVLTAAHCLVGVTPQTRVFFGADPAAGGTSLAVLDARAHPEFDRISFDNDIAVLLLDGEPPAAARPLELFAGPLDASHVGRPIRLVGFGRQGVGDTAPLRKRQGTSMIDQVFAADFSYGASPSQTCEGDSGGPAFMTEGGRELLIGVTSNGTSGCMLGADNARVDVHIAGFIAPYLVATGPAIASAGQRCFEDRTCAVGTCAFPADAPRIGYCVVPCPAAGSCPRSMVCGDDGRCTYRVPSPGALGTPCAAASDCDSLMCARSDMHSASSCSVACHPNAIACPRGTECLALAGAPERFGCFLVPEAEGCGCRTGGRAQGLGGPALAAAFVLLVAVGRLRRGREGRGRAGATSR